MAVNCPHCDRKINSTQPLRPGQYRLKCPGCQERFVLQVPADPASPWRVKRPHVVTEVVVGLELNKADPTVNSDRQSFEPQPHASQAQETGRLLLETPRPRTNPKPAHKTAAAIPLGGGSIPEPVIHHEALQAAETRVPTQLPGYQVEKAIGTGGMGSVFLGRQLSLDRPVAIKVMSRRWSNDPVFVARFTREAFAAALLNHPNVVQIYDIGDADGIKFFSMEYVAGRSLAEFVKTEGKLDPELAVGYILQAARGLKHAHDRGMIHRDVKPDNLLLNDQGIVKVADLGLVKTPELSSAEDQVARSDGPKSGLHTVPAHVTGVRMALGTPAYMAPEQCRDASSVDHRADIYSLGCTLYVLVTGKPPYEGHSALELMTKHAYEPLVPPELIVSRLPKELSAIIQRMMAKDPADRYQSMAEVIRTLEAWLGIQHTGTFCPRDEQIDQLEQIVHTYNTVPSGQLRSHIVTGFVGVCLLGAILLSFFSQLNWAFGVSGMILQAALAYFVMTGLAQKTYLFRRVRQFLLGLSVWDWALTLAGTSLFVLLLGMLGLFWVWAGFGLIAMGLAVALRFALDKSVDAERQEPLKKADRLLRRMRMTGVAEEDLRNFVAKYAGKHWEEFFEDLFGYEAKLHARQALLRGGSSNSREKFAAWREPLIALMDHIEKARQEARDRALLQQVEQARLLASGESLRAAQEQAAREAHAVAQQAKLLRGVGAPPTHPPPGYATPNLRQLGSSQPFVFQEPEPQRGPLGLLFRALFGKPIRATLAAVLLAGFVMWILQNRVGFGIDWNAQARQTMQAVQDRNYHNLHGQATELLSETTKPLTFEGIPPHWTQWVDSPAIGWAGLLLIASLFYRGNRLGFFLISGTVIMIFGHRLGIRSIEPLQAHHVSLMLGTVFALIGFRMARAD